MSNTLIQRRPSDFDPLLIAAAPGARPRSIGSSPRDLLFTLFWHRQKIAWFFLIGMTLTALAVLLLPSTYRSESTLLVKLGSESNADLISTVGNGAMVQPVIYRDSQMKTELELLKSQTIAEAVVDDLTAAKVLRKTSALADDKSDRTKALLALDRNLKLEVVPESSVLSIAYESGDPMLAHDITESYVKQYLIHRTEVYANQASAKVLEGQNADMKKSLMALMSDIKGMKQKAGIADVNTERLIVQSRLGELRKQISDSEIALHVADAQAKVLDEQKSKVPEFLSTGATDLGPVADLKKQIYKLEAQLAEARSIYNEHSTAVVNLKSQIADLTKVLADATVNGQNDIGKTRNPAFMKIEQDLLTAQAELSVKNATQGALRDEVQKCEDRLKQIDDLEQEIKGKLVVMGATEEQIRSLEAATNKAALMISSSAANQISVNQKATIPLRAVAPNRLMLLMLGAFVALSGAVGLGLVTEGLSRTAKRPEDIDRISHIPSVSVPVVDVGVYVSNGSHGPSASSPTNRVTRMLPGNTGSSGPVNGTSKSSGTAIDVRPARRWSPQLLQSAHGVIDGLLFDAIRDHKEEKSFVTGVIACRPDQGASTMASYVASAIADRLEASIPIHPDDRVLLVDTDMQEPSLHRLFHTPEGPGLGDWLSHTNTPLPVTDYICPTSHPRLSLMPAGQATNLMRLLDRADLLIASAGAGYRHIVIDLPAVSVSPTCLRLAAKCDAVLLVVESGGIHQEVVRRSIQALQNAGANVVGVVLNKRRYPIPDWLYERA